MFRAFKSLLVLTLVYHVISTTYQVNVMQQKLQNVYEVLGRIQAAERTRPTTGLDALKKDSAPGLDTMSKTYLGQPNRGHELDYKTQP